MVWRTGCVLGAKANGGRTVTVQARGDDGWNRMVHGASVETGDQLGAIAIIYARDDGGLDQGGSMTVEGSI